MRSFIARGIACALLSSCILLGSCLKDDLSDCAGEGISLRFLFTNNTEERDMFAQLVSNLDIYVFDEYGYYVYNKVIETASITEDYRLPLELDEGEYKIVSWGNLHSEGYGTLTDETRGSYAVEVQNTGMDVADLFYGMTPLKVVRNSASGEVSLVRNTNIVRVYISAAANTRLPENADISVNIEGSNTVYDFDNKPVELNPATYIPKYSTVNNGDEPYLLSEFKVQRLYTGCDVMINIYNEGRLRANDKLTERIFEHYDEVNTDDDLDRHYEYDLYYKLMPEGDILFAGVNIVDWDNPEMPGGI